ncbi:hypothetical protein AUR64_01365 [Haloprofundus marisrubri]|uniref:Uncharacterized protein n=1 Tax=Haloprofundus marisrubri TaxID=1514971 RepID=A0A0W1R3I9_9EURY|nr:hypothetical protein [Haloprofundus marisrubri]KTG07913.1 hypothetical protein AUR64_01365 [Haloprofundus marisrubri]
MNKLFFKYIALIGGLYLLFRLVVETTVGWPANQPQSAVTYFAAGFVVFGLSGYLTSAYIADN